MKEHLMKMSGKIWTKFAIWSLIDSEFGIINFARTIRSKNEIKNIAQLYQKSLTEKVNKKKWDSVIKSAWDLAEDRDTGGADAAIYAAAHIACTRDKEDIFNAMNALDEVYKEIVDDDEDYNDILTKFKIAQTEKLLELKKDFLQKMVIMPKNIKK